MSDFNLLPEMFYGLFRFGFVHRLGFGSLPNVFRTLPGLAVAVAEDFAFFGAFITSAHVVILL